MAPSHKGKSRAWAAIPGRWIEMTARQAWRSCPLGDHNKWSVRGHRSRPGSQPVGSRKEGHMLLGVEGRVESGRQVLLLLGSGLGALCPRPLRSLALSPASPTQCLLLTEGYLRNVLCSLDKALRYASWWVGLLCWPFPQTWEAVLPWAPGSQTRFGHSSLINGLTNVVTQKRSPFSVFHYSSGF